MTTNKQTLENIEGLLRSITAHLGITPGEHTEPDPTASGPLDEVLEEYSSVDGPAIQSTEVFHRLERVGRAPTIRNVLKELMRRETIINNHTVSSEKTGKVYRIYLTKRQSCTHPGGKTVTMYSTSDFSIPRLLEGGLTGWRIGDFAQVLEAFEMNDDQYLICEMLS